MPTVTLNRRVVDSLLGKKLPEEKLKDRISMIGTDLESVSKDEIVVEVFPNRPDMLSEQGFARALSAFVGVKPGLVEYKVKPSHAKVIIDPSVKQVRPATACALVKNLKLSEERIREIIQIQEKLHVTYGRKRKRCAIGVYPLEKIKLPITYTARKPSEISFVPLDFSEPMNGNEILEVHPTGEEFAALLSGKKVFPIFVDATGEILSMPPIINSEKTGRVTESTTEVFVECSGHDVEVVSICLNIIVTALADMGGSIYSMELVEGAKKRITPDLSPRKMKLDVPYYNKLLGLTVSEKECASLLARMGHAVKGKDVLVPAYRADILHQVDLAEDVAIAYGYENFVPEIPKVATIAGEDSVEVLKTKIISILNGLGCLETSTYHIVNEVVHNGLMPMNARLVRLANAVSQEYTVMRSYMLPCLMEVLSQNTHHEYPQRLCEVGTVFREDKKAETGVVEVPHVSVVSAHTSASFTEGKQMLDAVCRSFDISYELVPMEHEAFLSGRVAKIMMHGKDVGVLGEINPSVLENFKLEVPVVAFEVDVGVLEKSVKQ